MKWVHVVGCWKGVSTMQRNRFFIHLLLAVNKNKQNESSHRHCDKQRHKPAHLSQWGSFKCLSITCFLNMFIHIYIILRYYIPIRYYVKVPTQFHSCITNSLTLAWAPIEHWSTSVDFYYTMTICCRHTQTQDSHGGHTITCNSRFRPACHLWTLWVTITVSGDEQCVHGDWGYIIQHSYCSCSLAICKGFIKASPHPHGAWSKICNTEG